MKYLTHPVTLLALGAILGAAYGKRVPGISTVARHLPGSSVL